MTPRRWLIAAGAGLALLAGAFLAGRSSVPTAVVDTEKKATTDAHAQVDVKVDAGEHKTDVDTRKIVKRTITERKAPAVPATSVCPACPAVEEKITEEEEVNETSDEATDLTVHATDTSATDLHETVIEHTHTEARTRANLALQASGVWEEVRLYPSQWTAEGQARVAGPFWVGLGLHHDERGYRPALSARVEF